MSALEIGHRVALAREYTAAAGYPLRDRYGFAASDQTVRRIVGIVFAVADDTYAAEAIGMANALGEIELAMGSDTPTDEHYDTQIVCALRPLVEQRRQGVTP